MKYHTKIYYNSEDDAVLKPSFNRKEIDGKYIFIHRSRVYRFFAFLLYRLVVCPIGFVWLRVIKRVKYVNKDVLKQVGRDGYFIYSNHVDMISDALSPGQICRGKKPHIIVHPDNVSIPVVGKLNCMCGALPLPGDVSSSKNFLRAIGYTLSKDNPVVIYPEANLWPYYIKIRAFDERAFRYPVIFNKPVFVFTTTFQNCNKRKRPRIVIYIDGPFYIDSNLERADCQRDLRDRVYDQMVVRSKNSNCEYVKYIRRSDR